MAVLSAPVNPVTKVVWKVLTDKSLVMVVLILTSVPFKISTLAELHKVTPSLIASTLMAVSLVNVLLDSRVIMVSIAWILMNALKTFATLIPNNNQLNASISKVDGNANVLLVSLHQLISLLDHSELILISIVLILMNVFLILVAPPMATQQSA